MELLIALTLFQHLIDGFHDRDLRSLVADLLGVTSSTAEPDDLRSAPVEVERPDVPAPLTNRSFVTTYGWKSARLFSRLEARVFRPAMAAFTSNEKVQPFPLRRALYRG